MSAVWRTPLWLGVVTLLGLASAIVGDGAWDWACWAALTAPVAVIAMKLWRPRKKPKRA